MSGLSIVPLVALGKHFQGLAMHQGRGSDGSCLTQGLLRSKEVDMHQCQAARDL